MNDIEAYTIGNKYQSVGVLFIDSDANGLKYAIDDENRGVLIAGMKGKTGLTITQALAVCRELPGILQSMGYTVKLKQGGPYERSRI